VGPLRKGVGPAMAAAAVDEPMPEPTPVPDVPDVPDVPMADAGDAGYSGDAAVDGSGMATSSGAEAPAEEFRVGQFVRLTDLKSRPDLNGVIGTLKAFVSEKGRWAVKLSKGSEGEKLFKDSNFLALSEEDSATFAELSAPEKPERVMLRLKAAVDADRHWSDERGLQQRPVPKSRTGVLDPIMWHLEQNLCGGKTELANFTKKAMALVTQHPDRKDELPLDDERFKSNERLAHFLKAFRDAA